MAAVNAEFAGDLEAPSTGLRGLDFGLIANITHDTDRSYTVIDAWVENSGFEKVFVHLPFDWEFDSSDYAAKAEPIIVEKGALHRKYGFENDRHSFISNYFVFHTRGGFPRSKGFPLILTTEGDQEALGWYVNPNERLIFHIRLIPEEEEMIIDPFELTQNRSDIQVKRWDQEFVLYPDPDARTGFMRAPWLVKDGIMVEAFPGVFANLSAFPGDYYYDVMKLDVPPETAAPEPEAEVEELNPPAWDEWFSSTGLFKLNPVSLARSGTEFTSIPVINKTVVEEEPADEVGSLVRGFRCHLHQIQV
jgi:hypothetical protein